MSYQRNFAKTARIGIVGAGSHAYRNILPTLTFLPVQLVAIADRDFALAGKTAAQYGATAYASAAEMYASEQLDAVLLCVSPQLHPQLAMEAFAAGLDVWMEKPVADNSDAVRAMIAAQGERVCVVGYKKAFMPATIKAQELLASQPDPLRSILAVYPMNIPRSGDVFPPGEDSEFLCNGSHPLSLLLALGGPIESVATHRGAHGGGAMILNHANGAISTFYLADNAPPFQPIERYLAMTGRRSIEIANSRRLTYQRGIPFKYGVGTSFAPPGDDHGAVVWEAQDGLNTLENKAVFTQGVYNSLLHFFTARDTGAPFHIGSLPFALELTKVYEAAILSEGAFVAIEEEPAS